MHIILYKQYQKEFTKSIALNLYKQYQKKFAKK